MTQNKLTPQEKQMPEARLPAKILFINIFTLIVMSFVLPILWIKGAFAVMVMIAVLFVLPTLASMIAYINCTVRFDKDTVVCRSFLRCIRRYKLTEINDFETGGLFASAYIGNTHFSFNHKSQNGKWLAKLIELKLNPETEEQEELEELKYSKGIIYMLPFLMLGVIIFLHFVTTPSENIYEDILAYCFFICITIAVTIYALLYRNRRIFFSNTELLYIDGRKREHRYYWKDLSNFHIEGDAVHYVFGTEKLKHDVPLERTSLNRLRQKAESSLKENILHRNNTATTSTEIPKELSQDRAYIESKYRQKEGKLYNHNILSHTSAHTVHIMITVLLLMIYPVFWVATDPGMRLPMSVIMLFLFSFVPADIFTMRHLEKMPYFIAFLMVASYPIGYRLSLDFLEKIPIEKRADYIPLVISGDDQKRYDIYTILDIPAPYSEIETLSKAEHTRKTLRTLSIIGDVLIILILIYLFFFA